MKHYGDITKLNGAELPVVDCITGGSPCQDLSVAGKRAGLEGERSGLFMEQIRIVKEMREHDRSTGRTAQFVRPRWMVWENVPGSQSSGTPKGGDFQAVLTEIVRIVQPHAADVPLPPKGRWAKAGTLMGYGEDGSPFSISWRIHDAQFWGATQYVDGRMLFSGTPQRRKRIAVVADFGGFAAPEVLFERKGLSGDSDQSKQEREKTAGSTGTGSDEASGELLNPPVAGTLDSNYYKGPGERNGVERTNVIGFKPRNSSKARGVGCQAECSPTLSTNNNEAIVRVSGVDTYNQTMDCEIAQPLRAADGGDNTPKVLCNAYTLKVRGGKEIDSNGRKAGKGALVQTKLSGTLGVSQDQTLITSYGLTAKGNGDAFLSEERHTSLSCGGGEPGQGYPAVLSCSKKDDESVERMTYRKTSHPMNSEMGQGYEETDVSDTLNIYDNSESRTPTLVFENHLSDARYKQLGETCSTLTSRLGTGGNNQPLVLESNQNHATITINGVSPTLPASMEMGGGYVPSILEEIVEPNNSAQDCDLNDEGEQETSG